MMPEKKTPAETQIGQHYNNAKTAGLCVLSKKRFPAKDAIGKGWKIEQDTTTQEQYCLVSTTINNTVDPHCDAKDLRYGHNGIDIHTWGRREEH